MRVHWLEQIEGDVPIENDWLSSAEVSCLAAMRFPKRRSDWRLGRWAVKRALACYLGTSSGPHILRKIEIRPEPSGAPVTFISGDRYPICLSLSHRSGTALCAIAPSCFALGCDLEVAEERHPAFVTDYFTMEEQQYVARLPADDRWRMLAVLWSAKESALKALRTGLRIDTRSVRVRLTETESDPTSWSPLKVSCPDEQIFHGWYATSNNLVRTIVAYPAPDLPAPLPRDTFPALTIGDTPSQSIDIAHPYDNHASHQQ